MVTENILYMLIRASVGKGDPPKTNAKERIDNVEKELKDSKQMKYYP